MLIRECPFTPKKTLFESASGYGLRKALYTQKNVFDTADRHEELEDQITKDELEINELKGEKI